jgi:hypothetical protein
VELDARCQAFGSTCRTQPALRLPPFALSSGIDFAPKPGTLFTSQMRLITLLQAGA